MNLVWTEFAWEEYLDWQVSDRKKLRKINELIKAIQQSPFDGIGKPEALKFDLAGKWSRRIDGEHRLVYEVIEREVVKNKKRTVIKELIIYQCKYHY